MNNLFCEKVTIIWSDKHRPRLGEIETDRTTFPFFDRLVPVPEDRKAFFFEDTVDEHPADGVKDS